MTEEVFDLVSNTADGAVAIDRDQRIVVWNRAAETLLGLSAREMDGRPCYEVMCGRDDTGRVVCQPTCLDIVAARRRELVPTHEVKVCTRSGRDVWLSISSILAPAKPKDRCVLIHLFRDVSAQKELERGVWHLVSSVAKLPSARGIQGPAGPSLPHQAGELTRRERQILTLLASGASTRTIARQLFISPTTVRNHIQSILAKLGVHSQVEAVALSLRNGLV